MTKDYDMKSTDTASGRADQNKTHGVLTDAEIRSIADKTGYHCEGWDGEEWDMELSRAIEAAVLAKAAPQSPVAPADDRESDLYHEIECDMPSLFGRASNEGHAVGQKLAAEVQSKLRRARLADAPTVSATDAKISELLDIVEHPVSFPSTIEDPATRWEQSRRMQCSACYAKEDENEAIEHLSTCVWHKALAQRDRLRDLVRDLRSAAPTPPTSAADALPNVQRLIDAHAKLIEDGNSYAYFELAYTRHTEWMAWLCTNARENDPERKVIAKGQGSTPDEACLAAIAASKGTT